MLLTGKLNLKNIAIVAVFLGVSLFALRGLIFASGTVGLARDWVFPPFNNQYAIWGSKWFYSIDPFAGGLVNYYSAAYPLDLTMGLLSLFGLAGDIISKVCILFVMSFSGLSLYYLGRTVKVARLPSLVAGLFYMLCPVIFNHFVEGHFTYLVSYSIAPLILALFIRSVESNKVNIKTAILAGLVFVPAIAQVQFLIMIWIILLAFTLFSTNLKTIKLRLEVMGIVSLIVFCIHSPWILISLFGVKPEFVGHLAPSQLLQVLSPKMMDALLLLGGSGRANWLSYSNYLVVIAIPMIAFLAIILTPKNKMTQFFTIITVSSLFFAKGVNTPLGSVYSSLLYDLPIAGFRDVYHLMFIPALGYSILIGMATSKLTELSQKVANHYPFFSCKVNFFQFIIPFLLLLIMSGLLLPSLSGNFNGNVQVYNLGDDYKSAYDYIASLPGDSRIAWLPMTSVVFSNHSQLPFTARDPMLVFSPKPVVDADSAAVFDKYFAFIHKTLETQKTNNIGEILGTANVQYIISRSDTLSHACTPDRNWNQTQILDSQNNITLIKNFGDINVFSNGCYQPKITGVNNVALVAGDFSVFVKLGYSQFMTDQLPLLIFSQQLSPHDPLLNLVNTLIIQDNDYPDFAFSFIPSEFKLGAGSYASGVVAPLGWTYSGYFWGDPYTDWHYSTPLDEIAMTMTNDTLSIPCTAPERTFYNFWAKVYVGDKGSALNFSIDGEPLNSINTLAPYNKFEWIDIGSKELYKGEHSLNVTSDIGENAIGEIVIAPAQILSNAFKFANDALKNKRIIVLSEVEDSFSPNALLKLSDRWGVNASEGTGLVNLASSHFTASLSVPIAGNYKVFLRTTNPEYVNQPSNVSGSRLVDDFETIGDWKVIGEGFVSQSPDYVKSGNYSLQWAININKHATTPEEGSDHLLYKEIPTENWSAYNAISFWIYPKTVTVNPAEPNAQIFFHMKSSENDWFGGNYFVPFNQWTYLQIDISNWTGRSNVNLLRYLVGNPWGEYQDGQNVTFYIDQIKLDSKVSEGDFQWSQIGNVFLESGQNNVSIDIGRAGIGLDLIALQNTDNLHVDTGVSLNYSKINPVKYLVHFNATKPFFLVFSENFDPNWQASIDGTPLQHFKANSFANGYYVNVTGEHDIVINFGLESLYKTGQVVALSTFLICILIILIPKKKLRNIVKTLYIRR